MRIIHCGYYNTTINVHHVTISRNLFLINALLQTTQNKMPGRKDKKADKKKSKSKPSSGGGGGDLASFLGIGGAMPGDHHTQHSGEHTCRYK